MLNMTADSSLSGPCQRHVLILIDLYPLMAPFGQSAHRFSDALMKYIITIMMIILLKCFDNAEQIEYI